MRSTQWLSSFALLAICGFARAQVTLTARESRIEHNYVYGFGVDTHSGTGSALKEDLLDSDSLVVPVSGSASGVWANTFDYSASISGVMMSLFVLKVPSTNRRECLLIADNSLNASAGGYGGASLATTGSGNAQRLTFDVASSRPYRLNGNINFIDGGFAYLALEKFDGFTWQKVWYSWTLPGFMGTFDTSGIAEAGTYRLVGEISASAGTQYNPTRPVSKSSYSMKLKIGTRVTGTVNLEGFAGTAAPTVTVTITKGNETDQQEIAVDPITGAYELFTNLTGNATLEFKGRNWLSKTSARNLDTGSASVSLLNGDADNDNYVSILDYLMVSEHYGANSGDASWNTIGSNGFKPSDSDLDWDGEVSILDYLFVSGNYELGGN